MMLLFVAQIVGSCDGCEKDLLKTSQFHVEVPDHEISKLDLST
jgi:hypothetical protein